MEDNLRNKIRQAQIIAGEKVVIENLKQKGWFQESPEAARKYLIDAGIIEPIPTQAEPSTGSEEEKAVRIRKLAWQAFKDAGLTIFNNDEPTTCDSESFAMYEQGFADALKHIFKTTEELKKAFTTNKT